MKYQVTITNPSGQYKPISTIVDIDSTDKMTIINKGIQKICMSRYWKSSDMKKYGYTKAKYRIYDKDAIAKANAEKYEKIKAEKYACGEWKAPKRKEV